jgi:hypothetical protein
MKKGNHMPGPGSVTSDLLAIHLGSIAVTHGEEIGWVDHVLVEPMSWRAHALIVAGPPPQHQVTVPVQAVLSADGRATRMNVDTYTPLNPLNVPDQRPVDAGPGRSLSEMGWTAGGAVTDPAVLASLSAEQSVICRAGTVGRIDVVLVDARTHSATHVVVRCSDARRPDVRVPLWWTMQITPERLVLDSSWDQIDHCPGYRPDSEITEDVRAAVQRLAALAPRDFWPVDVQTRDGIVELHGMSGSAWARETLQRLARGLKGVVDVRDRGDQREAKFALDHAASNPCATSDDARLWTRESLSPRRRQITSQATTSGRTWSPSA